MLKVAFPPSLTHSCYKKTRDDNNNKISLLGDKITKLEYSTSKNPHIHRACAAVKRSLGSFTSNYLTKSLAFTLIVDHGFRRKSGLLLKTYSYKNRKLVTSLKENQENVYIHIFQLHIYIYIPP